MKTKLAAALFFTFVLARAAEQTVVPEQFLYGASAYPDLQTSGEWNRSLDIFRQAHFKAVRVGESSWGNLETSPGQYNFRWLQDYLNDVQRHGMRAILGTSSYIAPQWLSAKHPEILVENQPGWSTHPMARKAACINQPLYREAVRRYVRVLAEAFKDNPAVIGWQLDNEIEFIVPTVCYCPVCETKWREWLHRTYHTPQEFNRRQNLVSWGMQIESLDEVPQPRPGGDGGLPALRLAHLHFRRDTILSFLAEQAQVLREAGAKQWITTDWNTEWLALADDPLARQSLNVAGLNFYQPSEEKQEYFKNLAWQFDMHRSAHGLGYFMATETRVGVAGDTAQWDAFPGKEQFRMWMLQPAAFGAFGLMYWSGNRWHGGHWPHWGGVLDWTGRPEPGFSWLVELGDFFEKNSALLLQNPVRARAAVLTDFDQRSALDRYPHTPASKQVLVEAFDALHRNGTGADSMNLQDAAIPGRLGRYALVVIPAATALGGDEIVPALRRYVESGGNVVITPFTAYQTWDGLFRTDGFGANLRSLTGVIARTGRRMGTAERLQRVEWAAGAWSGNEGSGSGAPAAARAAPGKLLIASSPVGIDGYCEWIETDPGVEVIARFQSPEPELDGRPAAARKRIGRGAVIRLAFWPADDSVVALFRTLAPDPESPFASSVPPGVEAVPRSDKSWFLINTTSRPQSVLLRHTAADRISGRGFQESVMLRGYEVLWLAGGGQ